MEISGKKRDLIYLLIIGIIIIILLFNIFTNKFIGGTNDMEVHAYNFWYLKNSLIDYNKIPSWTSDHFGGKPFLGLYQPLTYFLALPISLIFNGVLTPKIFILVISLLSAYFFYLLAKKLFQSRFKAFLATLIFISFPSRLMIAGGGTLSEFTGGLFVPLSFLVYEILIEKPKLRYFALLGLFVGLCLLTHHAVGSVLLGALILIMSYDYFINDKKIVLKIIPFLLIGVIISFVFLIPAYQISNTLNFNVIKKHSSESFRPLSIFRFFSKNNSRSEYIGFIGLISIFGYLIGLKIKKENKLVKYWLMAIILLLVGLFLYPIIPEFIKATLERAVRMFSVLSVPLSIIIVAGMEKISEHLVKFIKKYNFLELNKEGKTNENIKLIVTIILVLLVFFNYLHFRPVKGNELQIPSGVVEFYKEIAKDKEYYRIEDQAFAPFGFSPILHKHGILNGGNYLAAPKYHFFFWSMGWSLLKQEPSIYNFAGLYGTLGIKYLLFKNEVRIPYLKEIKRGYNYAIYENEKFLDYVRLVPNIVVIKNKEPEHLGVFYTFLNQNIIPFDKVGFVHSRNLNTDFNLNRSLVGKVSIIKREPGYLKLNITRVKKEEYLVIAESYHPYWKAYQNDKELKIYEGIPSTLIIPTEKNGIINIKYKTPNIRFVLFLISISLILGLVFMIIYGSKELN